MSLRVDKIQKKRCSSNSDEVKICWNESNISEEDDVSISSEEIIGSERDIDERVRLRSCQEIWDSDTIWNSLQSLFAADKVIDSLKNEEYSNLTFNEKITKTALLIASWNGNDKALEYLLNNRASVHTLDSGGRSPLHLAACSESVDCLRLLLEAGAPPTVWDYCHRIITPLHCAASKGNLSCIKLLIKNGADVNAGLSTAKSPLHYAVQSLASDCVKELLEAGACPNTPQVFTETPLHVAAALGSTEIIQLLLEHGASVEVQCGPEKATALHLAAEDGDEESARILLNAGAQISATNYKLQTALHLAALAQSTETIQLCLHRGADPNATDLDGRTALHGAIAKVSRSLDSVKILINAGANVNKPDNYGYTPMHLAALNECSRCVLMLLNHGGDVTMRTKGGISVLTFITRRTPDVIPKYVAKLDSSIMVNEHEIGDVDCEFKLDFRVLVPAVGKGETELLLNFIEVGHREILKHPLCETFLFLKWRRIRKFFLFSLFYHTLFVLLFSSYVIGIYLRVCPVLTTVTDPCTVPFYIRLIGFCLVGLNCLVLGKEIFQIIHNWAAYIKQWENCLQWVIIICVFLTVFPKTQLNIRLNVQTWQHHVAGIGIFITWVELMMIVGRFPMFGLYIQMFTTVSLNFSKFLLAYFCLLIAFALSFSVVFSNYPSFQNLVWVLIKSVVMMSGELEFEDIFYDSSIPIQYPVTAHILFLAFVVLVTMILSNLMVGLAVSDIQGLQQSAGLDRLVRQAELVAHLETMLFSRLTRCLSQRLLKFFYKHALLLKTQYHWALYVRPNDPREERIPKELIANVYQLVAQRKERPKLRQRSKKKSSVNRGSSYLTTGNFDSNSGASGQVPRVRSIKMSIHKKMEKLEKEFQEWSKDVKQKLEKLVIQLEEKQT